MWTRVFLLILLLCSAPALAQTVPDFSGVFLGNDLEDRGVNTVITEADDPLVLNIKQGVGTLQVTEMQNGAQATNDYDLSGRPMINVSPDGVRSKDRIKFKDGKLLMKSEVTDPRFFITPLVTEETWGLSPDLQTLTIQPKIEHLGRLPRDFYRVETYTRQTSLRAALEKAQATSGMNKCKSVPSLPSHRVSPDIYHGIALGYTGFEELGWEVSFEARLVGEFFDDLKRTISSGGIEIRRNGKLIPTYSGSLTLEVTPGIKPHPRWEFSTLGAIMGRGNKALPDWLQTLRFRVKWVGSESRDLGEVPSELRQQPWPELSTPEKWYRLEIRAQDVPLTDSLEIHILSATGNQLGCISGHI